ncbi:MAG TPA: AtzH-like domain-containing protein [Streptosporangiaceae bacterium]|jgi:Asp-tRNA(Asn)/Glu-tRNA(Gln) amidotransferase A subunit family amidase|nr:AtzH-like domain-containing protein [Streptosporangiaceae bacterium]
MGTADESNEAADSLAAGFTELDDPVIAALLNAFWSYERALAANDVPALEGWFADDPATLRTDGAATLVGHDEISAFRRDRPVPPPRMVERLHVRAAGPGAVFAVAESVREDGGTGAQSQLWIRGPQGWRVSAAHVATAPPVPRPGAAPRPGTPRRDQGGRAAQESGAAQEPDPRIWRHLPEGGEPVARGAAAGLLAGARLAVKDLFAIAGERIGAGNPDWLAETVPQTRTAPAVQALLDAGADVTGIAQTDEFAFSLAGANAHYGAPDNAAVPGCITGGSSSGPAAAVAAGLADIGLGTDTAGSIRVPASYCGLYSIRPTHGAVSTAGMYPLAPSFDTVGLLARDPGLLRRAAGALLPGQDSPPVTALHVAADLPPTGPAMRPAFVAGVRALSGRSRLPLRRVPAIFGGQLERWFGAFRTVQACEAWEAHGRWLERHPGSVDPAIAARFAVGRDTSSVARAQATELVAAARKILRKAIPPGTALVLPASSTAAPRHGLPDGMMEEIRAATLRLTFLASVAGLPAVVIPALRAGSRPAGLCLVGAPGSDRALLDIACRRAWDGAA